MLEKQIFKGVWNFSYLIHILKKKPLRLRDAIFHMTWYNISCKPLLGAPIWLVLGGYPQLIGFWQNHGWGWVSHGPTPSIYRERENNEKKITLI
jgi:hypothetical protein